ncbi:DNA sulfur modification protein DndD [Nakamurella panacisegetis]|uniref:Nuclease SbcCD subunit C n=1 Tax=Nakamurella panacisegetis TaxID=1090615 RepID=A0A1H0ISP5_9ACTN|nr:AAA family ATPase [Nakamurella panacisegetis]SDO34486.1 DNA sulfur modification protein DndD [Nakamurella panacisegetis]
MKLQSITLTNFRQFQGIQSINLTSDAIKPVTLLFGANGAGKTTLLNAFTWGLYGSMSDDVEQQDRMITDTVWRGLPMGQSADVAVEICFAHEGQDYRLHRGATLRKVGDEQGRLSPQLQLWTTQADGSSEASHAPQETVLSILPVGVSRFFFFNGERIENLVKKGAYAEVQKDIKVLLDLEQVERAISHLPKVNRKLTAELAKHGGATLSAIQDGIDKLTDRQSKSKDELKVIEADLATLAEERDATTELLRQHAEAAPIQAERDAVSTELGEAKNSRDAAVAEQATLVATKGFQAFTEELGDKTRGVADNLYEKGALPAPLKREFVDQLLDDGACICGTQLVEHSDPWEHVKEWRQRAGLQAVETAWQQLSGQIALLADARSGLRDALAMLMGRVQTERDRVARLEARKSEIDGKLRDSRLEGVQDLETKRMDLEGRIAVKNQRKGSLETELANIAKEIEHRTKERSRAQVTDELASKARSRSDLVQYVKKALEDILSIREEDMRLRLDAELKAVFKSITHQAHVPTLSEGFELTLHKDVNGVQLQVPKSTGENQILSLSFVAAVSKIAREVRKGRRAEGASAADAGTFPIVMDAAFGSLDQDYQEAVSRALAKMAPQLVVLVSKSQGLGKVVKELLPYVSHLGVIETHTTAEGNVSDDIELEGMSYPYIRSADTDHSELKVIK